MLPWIVEYFLAWGKRLSYRARRETASVTRSRCVDIYLWPITVIMIVTIHLISWPTTLNHSKEKEGKLVPGLKISETVCKVRLLVTTPTLPSKKKSRGYSQVITSTIISPIQQDLTRRTKRDLIKSYSTFWLEAAFYSWRNSHLNNDHLPCLQKNT